MLIETFKYGKTEFDYPEVDFTIDFVEVPYTPAVMVGAPIPQEEKPEGEQKGIRALLPFPIKKESSDFQAIPVQLNDNIINNRQSLTETVKPVEQVQAKEETAVSED